MLKRISKITERWFLSEEALFSVFCTHRVAENSGMECHVRVGKGVIEVNPDLCADISDKELEERLRVEVIRILLKHPYERQPDGCCITARALGSNCVIGDSYHLQKVDMEKPSDFKLPPQGHFEFYARCIQKLLQKMDEQGGQGGQDENAEEHSDYQGEGGGSSEGTFGKEYADIAANWQQDELMAAQVNEIIRDVKSVRSSEYRANLLVIDEYRGNLTHVAEVEEHCCCTLLVVVTLERPCWVHAELSCINARCHCVAQCVASYLAEVSPRLCTVEAVAFGDRNRLRILE